VSPVKYELGFYIQEDDVLHCDGREALKYYVICFGEGSAQRRAGVKFQVLYMR
jgi:hypothetical protein